MTEVSSEDRQTKEFLEALFEPNDLILLRFLETWTEDGKKRSNVHGTCHVERDNLLGNLPHFRSQGESTNSNHFFGVCPRAGGKGKYDLACQVRVVRALWSDIDHCGVEEAKCRCADGGLPEPSIVVSSGNGVHLYWLLEAPYLIDDCTYNGPLKKVWDESKGRYRDGEATDEHGAVVKYRELLSGKARKLQSIQQGMAMLIGGDHTQDVSRILRLPGTLNRKDIRNGASPKPCLLVECDRQRRYSIELFEKYHTPYDAVPVQGDVPALPPLPSDFRTIEALSEPDRKRFDELLARCGNEAEDRSAQDWKLLCWCAERGLDRATVWAAVCETGKFADRGEGYFEQTWTKAAEAAAAAHAEAQTFVDAAETITPASSPPTARDMTDVGNALLFERLHGKDLRWVKEWKRWIRWTGHYWQPIEQETVIAQYVQPMVRYAMPEIAKTIEDDEQRKRWHMWCYKSNSSRGVRDMLSMAQPRMMVQVHQLNGDPNLLATQNAVLDLRTCEPVPPQREQWITLVTPVAFDPDADCPTFRKFVSEILVNEDETPCPQMVSYMQRALGYCLTPSVSEQVFFVLWGVGQNGKTTLMETISGVLGEYAVAGSESLYFESRDRTNSEDVASLYRKRLCVTNESKAGGTLSEAKIKRITGGETITAMRKHEHQFSFSPTHKLFLCCNDKPKFSVDDPAIIRRIKLVPFYHVVPSDQRDAELPAKLRAELPGILNWMLDGLRAYNNGQTLGEAHTPDLMKAAKEGYIGECDRLGEFIEEQVRVVPDALTPKAFMYQAYRSWAESNGMRPYAQNNLTRQLEKRGWQERRTEKGRFWSGFGLVNLN